MKTKRDHLEMEKRRRAARLFAKDLTAAEVGRRLGSHPAGGALLDAGMGDGRPRGLGEHKGKAGAPLITKQQRTQVVAALLERPRATGHRTKPWTLPRMSWLIEEITGVSYHPGHVWRLLGSLGFSCQHPERRAIERDEKAVRVWQRKTWPALKKTR